MALNCCANCWGCRTVLQHLAVLQRTTSASRREPSGTRHRERVATHQALSTKPLHGAEKRRMYNPSLLRHRGSTVGTLCSLGSGSVRVWPRCCHNISFVLVLCTEAFSWHVNENTQKPSSPWTYGARAHSASRTQFGEVRSVSSLITRQSINLENGSRYKESHNMS